MRDEINAVFTDFVQLSTFFELAAAEFQYFPGRYRFPAEFAEYYPAAAGGHRRCFRDSACGSSQSVRGL